MWQGAEQKADPTGRSFDASNATSPSKRSNISPEIRNRGLTQYPADTPSRCCLDSDLSIPSPHRSRSGVASYEPARTLRGPTQSCPPDHTLLDIRDSLCSSCHFLVQGIAVGFRCSGRAITWPRVCVPWRQLESRRREGVVQETHAAQVPLIQKPGVPRVLGTLGYVRNVGATGSNPVTSTRFRESSVCASSSRSRSRRNN